MTFPILTRVCMDDFDIFRIWVEYYQRRNSDIRCCISKRPTEDIDPLIVFCRAHGIRYGILEAALLNHKASFGILRKLCMDVRDIYCLVVDCDEFVTDFEQLDHTIKSMPADHVWLKSRDRTSYRVFYDISDCSTYEDLCAVAPLHVNLTKDIQDQSDKKVCISKPRDVGKYFKCETAESAELIETYYLDHFKWRSNWVRKTEQRLAAKGTKKLSEEKGVRTMLELVSNSRPLGYLTIPGFFDYDNIFDEQCRLLPNGATLVEIGIWKGRSIAYLAESARLAGKNFNIFGVDLFEEKVSNKPVWKDCSLYDTKSNLEWRGLGGKVVLLKTSSVEASFCFADNSIDFLWLDGDHRFESVIMDITAWLPKIKPGGTIGGHDITDKDVVRALTFLGLEYSKDRNSWLSRDCRDGNLSTLVPLPMTVG